MGGLWLWISNSLETDWYPGQHQIFVCGKFTHKNDILKDMIYICQNIYATKVSEQNVTCFLHLPFKFYLCVGLARGKNCREIPWENLIWVWVVSINIPCLSRYFHFPQQYIRSMCNNLSVETAPKLVSLPLPSLNLRIPLMDTIYVPVPVQHHFGNLHKYCQIKMSN